MRFLLVCCLFLCVCLSVGQKASFNLAQATGHTATEPHTDGTTGGVSTGTHIPTDGATTGVTATNEPSKCSLHIDCEGCTGSTSCVWCDTDKVCIGGTWYGPSDKSDKCDGWRWKQCNIKGTLALIIAASGAGGVLLLLILSIVCCCCCCGSRRKAKRAGRTSFYTELDQDKEPLMSKTPQTDKRREELYKKYGHILNRQSAASSSNNDISPLNA